MGGDHAPAATVAAAVEACRRCAADVTLVGEARLLHATLERLGARGQVAVVAAPDVVGMGEDPALAVRAKPDASVRVAARLVADGQADAMVSAGSTGATLAASLLTIGRTPGIRRPAIAAVLPVRGGDGAVVLVDAGGSADPQPEDFLEYARMGLAYARVRGVDAPRFGLLNVGGEPRKGNVLARSGSDLLGALPTFAGNVEPGAVLDGAVDVVVTDGFTGNIFLKTLEAVHHRGHPPARPDAAAVLLGVRGEVLVTHGAADEDDIAEAIAAAACMADAGLSTRIAAVLTDAGDRR